ncbi:MAG: 2-oxoacid:acceptor oxidoreductase family protein, partial [Candidatus Pacearchaeota archaeon]|nr:2-oxoacid:acceptor oxidoreductase family protein [Candidatus Pacearchaeota archaeon]
MKISILIGGKAGQGPNILSQMVGDALVSRGYNVFYTRDYESLIRGGHNFNMLTFSDEKVGSNESKADILVCLDEKTKEMHKRDLKKNAQTLDGTHDNMYHAGALFKILGLEFEFLEERLKKLKNYDENLKHAKEGYAAEKNVFGLKPQKGKKRFMNGSHGICEGAIKSGLDLYYAYPMTPATPLLFELAPKQHESNFLVLEMESEVSVINAAIGSAITGAKAMVGTSGGGFDLMTEALSMTGMAEIPMVICLAQRPGPGTGVATYSSQGDLKVALGSGHGEFSRLVIAPGNPKECEELTSQAF